MREKFVAVSTLILIGWWGAFVLSMFLVGFAAFVIPQFESIFEQFGADLPSLTTWVAEHRWYTLMFPWVVLVLAILVTANRTMSARNHVICMLLLAATLLVLFSTAVAMVFAMYLPIIRMGGLV